MLKRLFIYLMCLLPLSGCAGDELSAPLICPEIGLVKHADTATFFKDGAEETEVNALSYVQIQRYRRACSYDADTADIVIDLDLAIAVLLGPASFGTERPMIRGYPYFIAVLDSTDAVVTKQVFTVEMEFPEEAGESFAEELLRQKIPVASPSDGKNYRILIGLQLDEAQLSFNRRKTDILKQRKKGL